MIGGVIKYFRFNYEYVLWGISYQNLSMLLATIPSYDTDEKKKDEEVKEVEGIADLKHIFGD